MNHCRFVVTDVFVPTPTLVAQLEAQGKSLLTHVHQDLVAYVKHGRLKHAFLQSALRQKPLRAVSGVFMKYRDLLSEPPLSCSCIDLETRKCY